MSRKQLLSYDVANHLRTPAEMAGYLQASLEDEEADAAFIAKALGDIARAYGMTHIARKTGLSRESLYKSLSGARSPDFQTILRVVRALGLELRAAERPTMAPTPRSRPVPAGGSR